MKHNLFVLSLWLCVWLLGTWPLGRPLSEGWRFMSEAQGAGELGPTTSWTIQVVLYGFLCLQNSCWNVTPLGRRWLSL